MIVAILIFAHLDHDDMVTYMLPLMKFDRRVSHPSFLCLDGISKRWTLA